LERWTRIELFVQVAETGSLSRAAEALDLSNATASRHLSALEERLGVRLVERNTTRPLYLIDNNIDVANSSRIRASPSTAWRRRAASCPPRRATWPSMVSPTRKIGRGDWASFETS